MSMNYADCLELGAISDCCCAPVYSNGICTECNDHCIPVKMVLLFEEDEEELEKESSLMDKYRDVGMSPSDFM